MVPPAGSSGGGAHVAIMAFPFGSHAAPLLAVVRRLAAAAPESLFSFLNTAKSNSAIFSGHNSHDRNLKAYDVYDGVPDNYVFTGRRQEEIEMFLEAAEDSFKKGLKAAEVESGRRVSCLVTDAFLWFSTDMAAEMGVPWMPFWTAGLSSLSSHLHTDLIRDTIREAGGFVGRDEETLSFIPGLSRVRIKDLPEGVLFGNTGSVFSAMLQRMGRALPRAAAVFINCFEELDPEITKDLKSKLKQFLSIGPFDLLSKTRPSLDPHGCLSWIGNQKSSSVAYISFGTVSSPPPSELQALAEGLEDSRVPFIWSLKEKDKVHLPTGFVGRTKEQGMVVPWAPQPELLAHEATGAFVTHCGWNSVLESIGGGVPMIGRPFFGDQMVNARMVEDAWGIGVRIDGGVLTKDGFLRCLQLVMAEEKGKKMKDRVKELQGLAQRAVSAEGSSTGNFTALSELVSR